MKFVYPNLSYSYAEVLAWSNISKNANGTYICQTVALNSSLFNYTTQLDVKSKSISLLTSTSTVLSLIIPLIFNTYLLLDAKLPAILNTSGRSISVDQYNEFSLFCEGDGLPRPIFEWFKVK